MTLSTVAERTLLRTQPHLTKLYLSIYKPTTVFSCRVTGSATKGDRVINYDGASGNLGDLDIGLTVYVGTTAGGKDKGSIYLFDWDASTLTVGENSHINWADNDYITIVNFYQIWPVYPRYVQSDTDITVYKAHDFAYTNQNEVGGTFICMGPHHATFLSTGSASVYYTAAWTHNVKGIDFSFVWEFEGGTPSYVSGSAGSAVTPGWVTYDTPGHYSTTLWAYGGDGTTDRSIRHISIYDRPEEGTNVPILKWGLESLSGSRETGGYIARLWAEEDLDDIVDGALVVIFADDYYGTTKQSIGGNATNRSEIVFVGYIMDGSIERDYQRSRFTFEVGSPTEIMKIGEAFSVSVEDSQNPTTDAEEKGGDPWFYYKDLTVKRALYHYIRWHTSIFRCMDIQYTGDDFPIQFFDSDRSSLYDALHTFIKSSKFGNVVCDRQGKLYFETEAEAINNASSTLVECITLERQDWINEPAIEEQQIPRYSYIEMGGVAYSGSTGTYTPLLAAAPGQTPAYRGHNEKISGLALDNQTQLNTLAGNIFAARNARYPDTRLEIVGNYRIFDIAPQEKIVLTMNADENHRGITWTQKAFIIQSIEWAFDSRAGLFKPTIDLKEITQGYAADSVSIPVEPPDDGYEDVPPPVPPPIFPPVPIPTPQITFGYWFVPAIGGYNNGGGVAAPWMSYGPDPSYHGISLDGIAGSAAGGAFAVPLGASQIIATPVIYNLDVDQTVGIYVQIDKYHFGEIADYDFDTLSSNFNFTGFNLNWLTSHTITTAVTPGDLIVLFLETTSSCSILFAYGWMIQFI